jgi:hypothetical protein
MEANLDPPFPGSRLDADHPENGVLIPRRYTMFADILSLIARLRAPPAPA